jgi:hypothetical protein
VRQWRKWERAVQRLPRSSNNGSSGGGGRSSPWNVLARLGVAGADDVWRRVGGTRCCHAVHVALRVVTTDLIFSPVTKPIYYSLRLFFIDRLSLDRSFDYCNFVER